MDVAGEVFPVIGCGLDAVQQFDLAGLIAHRTVGM
jgi:hypothetical protein